MEGEAFSRLLRQLVCANPNEYGIAAYSNSSKTEIFISKRWGYANGLMIQKEIK